MFTISLTSAFVPKNDRVKASVALLSYEIKIK